MSEQLAEKQLNGVKQDAFSIKINVLYDKNAFIINCPKRRFFVIPKKNNKNKSLNGKLFKTKRLYNY